MGTLYEEMKELSQSFLDLKLAVYRAFLPGVPEPEEFAEKMKSFGDCHWHGDDLLCDTLEAIGYKDGVDVFRKMHKWQVTVERPYNTDCKKCRKMILKKQWKTQ